MSLSFDVRLMFILCITNIWMHSVSIHSIFTRTVVVAMRWAEVTCHLFQVYTAYSAYSINMNLLAGKWKWKWKFFLLLTNISYNLLLRCLTSAKTIEKEKNSRELGITFLCMGFGSFCTFCLKTDKLILYIRSFIRFDSFHFSSLSIKEYKRGNGFAFGCMDVFEFNLFYTHHKIRPLINTKNRRQTTNEVIKCQNIKSESKWLCQIWLKIRARNISSLFRIWNEMMIASKFIGFN